MPRGWGIPDDIRFNNFYDTELTPCQLYRKLYPQLSRFKWNTFSFIVRSQREFDYLYAFFRTFTVVFDNGSNTKYNPNKQINVVCKFKKKWQFAMYLLFADTINSRIHEKKVHGIVWQFL